MVRRLSDIDRERATERLSIGCSTRCVVRQLGCHQSTIVRLSERFLTTTSGADRLIPGGVRATTARQNKQILTYHFKERTTCATATTRSAVRTDGNPISERTERRIQRAARLAAGRLYVGHSLQGSFGSIGFSEHVIPVSGHKRSGKTVFLTHKPRSSEISVAKLFAEYEPHRTPLGPAWAGSLRVQSKF